jgi:hypothetical protein
MKELHPMKELHRHDSLGKSLGLRPADKIHVFCLDCDTNFMIEFQNVRGIKCTNCSSKDCICVLGVELLTQPPMPDDTMFIVGVSPDSFHKDL